MKLDRYFQSEIYRYETSPRRQMQKLLAAVGLMAFAFVSGAYAMFIVLDGKMEEVYDNGYLDGKQEVMKRFDHKEAALSDQVFYNKLCNAWWFRSTASERTLKAPK